VVPFVNSEEMAQSLGAADIVVSRAGATTILILRAQLAAGHQMNMF
jgi:UDP-N-acetylglucosamine:LPS N-acetylglucosamine transferase